MRCLMARLVTSALLLFPLIVTLMDCLVAGTRTTSDVAPSETHIPAPLEPADSRSSSMHISKKPVTWPGLNAFAFITISQHPDNDVYYPVRDLCLRALEVVQV